MKSLVCSGVPRREAVDLEDSREADVPEGLRTENHTGKGRVSELMIVYSV